MRNPVSQLLAQLGLRTPLKRAFRYMTDEKRRQRIQEINADIEATVQQVGDWATQPLRLDDDKIFAIVSFTDLPLHAKFHWMMAKMMQLHGYQSMVFLHKGNRQGEKYFERLGINNVIKWEICANELVNASAVRREVETLLQDEVLSSQSALDLTLHGVDVGKHAMSVTARRLTQGSLDLDNPDVRALFMNCLTKAVSGVLVAEKLFDRYPIKTMLVRDSGYIPNGAIYEVALQRGIDCVVYEQGQRRGSWLLKRYTSETKGHHYFSVSDDTWEKVKQEPWTEAEDAKLQAVFDSRYKPDSTEDTRRLMADKELKSPDEVRAMLNLNPDKKTAVIFSHIAWDAAFFYGSCLFNDFEDWLYKTVKFVAAKCPDMNWVVKLHPFNVFKLKLEDKDEESEMRLLRDLMPLPNHVQIMRADTPISTQSLFPVIDYVLTVNGTVGMEFPCFGVPALLAGTGRYNGRGFTMEPQSREEYYEALRTLHTVPRLDDETVTLARKHYYTVVERRQTDMDDVAYMELKRANEADTDIHDNLQFCIGSLAEFKANPTVQRVSEWLANSDTADILEPRA